MKKILSLTGLFLLLSFSYLPTKAFALCIAVDCYDDDVRAPMNIFLTAMAQEKGVLKEFSYEYRAKSNELESKFIFGDGFRVAFTIMPVQGEVDAFIAKAELMPDPDDPYKEENLNVLTVTYRMNRQGKFIRKVEVKFDDGTSNMGNFETISAIMPRIKSLFLK